MAISINCTHCGEVLKSLRPIPPGTLLTCPQCHEQFENPMPLEETPARKTPPPLPPPLPASAQSRTSPRPPPLPKSVGVPADESPKTGSAGSWLVFVSFVGLLVAGAAGGIWYFGKDRFPDLKNWLARNQPEVKEQEVRKDQDAIDPQQEDQEAPVDPADKQKTFKRDTKIVDETPANAAADPVAADEFEQRLESVAGTFPEELKPEDEFFPRRKMIIPLENGEPHGSVCHIGPQRRLMCVDRYVKGLLAERRTFFPSGQPFSLVRYVEGRPHGKLTTWFENGNRAFVQTWDHGNQTGPATVYALNGNLGNEANYVNGVAQGERKHYLPDGRLFGISQFQDGQEVSQQVLIEPNLQEFQAIQARADYSLVLKDHWTANHIAADREQGHEPPGASNQPDVWVPLFNGKNLDGWWPTENSKDNVKWEVRNGILVGMGQGRMGYLYRDEDDYQDFKLRAEVRINASGNSGLMFRGLSEAAFETGWPKGLEAQIAVEDKTLKTGGLYVQSVSWTSEFPSARAKTEPAAGAETKGRKGGRTARSNGPITEIGNPNELHHRADEWFHLEVTMQGKDAEVTVNGTKTAEGHIEQDSTQFPTKGFIGLQINPKGPTTVEFRKIEVMRLTPK